MPKLTICVGLPASGKTTWAREQLAKDGNTIRLNRDDMRAMMRGKWSGRFEDTVIECEREQARIALHSGWNVIIDDTNLSRSIFESWEGFSARCSDKFHKCNAVEVSIQSFTDTPFADCISRDAARPNPVGRPVIERMAAKYGLTRWGNEIAIFDLDGTLSDPTHRLHHVQKEPKDWPSFLSEVGKDGVRHEIVQLLRNEMLNQRQIVIVSGRSAEYWSQTEWWLRKNAIHYDHILMRQGHDRRPDTEVKLEILNMLPADGRIKVVYDDRPSVVKMWKENGLNVVDVGNGIDF